MKNNKPKNRILSTNELLKEMFSNLRTHAELVAAGMDSNEASKLIFGEKVVEESKRCIDECEEEKGHSIK
jgi:hypothetical protein